MTLWTVRKVKLLVGAYHYPHLIQKINLNRLISQYLFTKALHERQPEETMSKQHEQLHRINYRVILLMILLPLRAARAASL